MQNGKPDRGRSLKTGIIAVVAIVGGIIGTAAALQADAPAFFSIFGMMLLIFGIMEAISCFASSTGTRSSSMYSFIDDSELTDAPTQQPSAEAPVSATDAQKVQPSDVETRFCPYCGAPAASDYAYCRRCGKKLPE